MLNTRPLAIGIVALGCAVLAACSPLPPAAAPPQLTHTPGAQIAIANGHVDAGSFQFDYPPSWRLVKDSAANADGLHIRLQAPSGGELSFRVVESVTDDDAFFIPLAKGRSLLIAAEASTDVSAANESDFQRIIRSIRS